MKLATVNGVNVYELVFVSEMDVFSTRTLSLRLACRSVHVCRSLKER